MRARPRPPIAKRNLIALELWSPKYRPKRVAAEKGPGSYKRPSNRRPDASRDGGSISGMVAIMGSSGARRRLVGSAH